MKVTLIRTAIRIYLILIFLKRIWLPKALHRPRDRGYILLKFCLIINNIRLNDEFFFLYIDYIKYAFRLYVSMLLIFNSEISILSVTKVRCQDIS